MKKIWALALAVLMLIGSLSACKSNEDTEKTVLLSFSQAQSVEEMQKYDGRKVSIIGYMSTLSPITGKFMYLMNLPYQSCPFCVPNTTTLSNTMAVYAKDEFEFTDRAIQVTGKMEFGDYTDEFGYNYGYRIVDAVYEVLDTSSMSSSMSEELRLWQQLASTDIMSDVYAMFEYLNFLCYWPTYTSDFGDGRDYLYPVDALKFLETDGEQYNYGFKDGYFEALMATVKEVDEDAFAELIDILADAKALSERAYAALKGGQYELTEEYSNTFNDGRNQYQITDREIYEKEMDRIYTAFSHWLSTWEI